MAQCDLFLKIEGAPGESLDEKHKGEIELESFNWSASNGTTIGSATGGAGAGKIRFEQLNIVKRVDKSSPVLFMQCATGNHYKEVKLTARKAGAGQQDYLTFTMKLVFLTKYETVSDQHSNGVVFEHISMVFGQMEIEYKEQKPDGSLGGSVKQGYDQVTNKKL